MKRISVLLCLFLSVAFGAISWAKGGMPFTGNIDWADVDGKTSVGLPYDNSTSALSADTVQEAIDELEGLIGSANTTGLNWAGLDETATTTGLDEALVVWSISGTTYKMTGENMADWVNSVVAGLTDGDKGSLTVSESGTVWTIDSGAISAAMMANADHGDVAWSSGTATVQAATGAFAVGAGLDVVGVIQAGSGNHDLTNAAGLIDGEKIQDDTIDDDSIDLSDFTLADITFDVGSVDTTEFGYLNGVSSAIQTQLDARCLESVLGTALDASQLAVTSNSLGIIEGGVTTTEILANTITAADLAAALTFSEGDLADFSAITMSAGVDEGIALPTYADVAPANEKYYMAYSPGDNAIMVRESGGWVNASSGSAAPTNAHYIVTGASGSLSEESVLAAGEGIDVTDAGGDGGNVTIAGEDATDTNKGIASFSTDNFSVSSGAVTIKDKGIAAAELADADFGIFTVASGTASLDADTVNATHIDWGTGANQIDVTDVEAVGSVNILLETEIDGSSELLAIMDDETGTGSLVFATTPTLVTPVLGAATGTSLALGADPADAGALMLSNAANIAWEASAAGTDVVGISVDSSEVVQIGSSGASGVTITPATTITGALTVNGNGTFGDADTDTLAVRGLLIGADRTGSNDAVQIAGSLASPTYATATNELYVAGDVESAGTVYATAFISTGSGADSYAAFANNTTLEPSGDRLYFEGNILKVSEDGTERIVLKDSSSATLTGTTWDFSGVTNFEVPNAASVTTDAFGEIGADNNAWAASHGALQFFDGTASTWLLGALASDTPSNGQVPKWNTDGTITWEDDNSAGAPSINTVTDATADAAIDFDINEEIAWNYTGNFTTGSQFLIEQLTGNPTGGVLFEVKSADSNVTAAKIGDGTNAASFAQNGSMSLAGTALITAGGIILGDASPDANGELGYATNAFTGYANSEDFAITAGANLWTFSSGSAAAFAFTPAVTLTGGIASIGAASNLSGGTVTLGTLGGTIVVPTGATLAASGTGTITATALAASTTLTTPNIGAATGTSLALGADPGDSGAVRLSNNTAISWEASTPGTDIFIALDGSDILQVGQNCAQINIGTSGTGNVGITGDLTVTGSDINVGAAGMKLTGDGDGAITLLGLGDGYDEDLTINLDDTENTAKFSSSTGVTAIDFSALNLATTGTISGKVPIVTIGSGRSITSAEAQGSFIMVTAAGTYTLPAAATAGYGSTVCIYVRDASETVVIEVDNADKIRLYATALNAGNTIDSPGAAGNFVCLMAVTDTDGSGTDGWITLGASGTWTDGGAT